MRRVLTRYFVPPTLAALLTVTLATSTSVFGQDTDTPVWLVSNTSYAGVWKTLGANAAQDLDSQITLGYTGDDGNQVLLAEDGRLALLYGFNPIGTPNHMDVKVLATRTPEGFRWGQFDPGRNSGEVTCTVANDGATLSCARHAMFNGREFFNTIEMTRMTTGDGG